MVVLFLLIERAVERTDARADTNAWGAIEREVGEARLGVVQPDLAAGRTGTLRPCQCRCLRARTRGSSDLRPPPRSWSSC